MKETKTLKQDPNYPENFWPRIIFLLSVGGFIYWAMTSPDASTTLHKLLLDPIKDLSRNRA